MDQMFQEDHRAVKVSSIMLHHHRASLSGHDVATTATRTEQENACPH